MKRKNIDIDNVKFLMERMEKRYTLNEVQSKISKLIKEGVGDDIVRSALKSADNAKLSKFVDDITIVQRQGNDIQKSIETFDAAFDNIRSSKNIRDVLNQLPSASSLRVSTRKFVDSFSNLLKKVALDGGVDIDLKKITDYVNGLSESYPVELLDVLTSENLSQIQIVRDGIKELNLINTHLSKLNKIADTWRLMGGQKMDIRNAIISLIGKDGVESVENLKKSIRELDELEGFEFELADDLNDSWLKIKEELGLDVNNIDLEIQKSFRNDPAYELIEKGFKTKLKKLLSRNADNIDITAVQLRDKNIDWGKTIIYENQSTNEIMLIQFKDVNSANLYREYLTKNGFKMQNAVDVEDAIVQIKEMATKNNRIRKIRLILIIGIPSTILLFGLVCATFFKEDYFSPEQIAKRIKAYGEEAATEEESWFSKFGRCYTDVLLGIANFFKDVGDTVQNNLKGLGQDMVMKVCEGLKEICPNWECCHTDDCGDIQKECCMECNNETEIEKLAGKLKGQFLELMDKLESVQALMQYAEEYGNDVVEQVKKNIEKNGVLSGLLFKDGKPMTIVEFIKLTCTKQNIKCVEKRSNEIFKFITNEFNTKNCDTLTQERNIPIKIEELRRFNKAGYLTLNEGEEGKVYINWQKVIPTVYGSAKSVDECINIMENMYTGIVMKFCSYDEQFDGEISIDRNDYEGWCEENGKDSSVVKSLMEYLWKEGVVKLECGIGEDSIRGYFDPNPETKNWAKFVIYDRFRDSFEEIFTEVDNYSTDWDDAFNYWYDKQKNECGF